MEFKKVNNGYIILVNGQEVGTIQKDENKNYQFNHVVKLNFEIMGYRNSVGSKTWKAAKIEAEKLYNNLMELNQKYGKEIIKTA
jgi:hypothetical protein